MWLLDADLDRVFSRAFVEAQLLPEEAQRLDRPPGFGAGLTDDTYWAWLSTKARRLFLVLVDLGIPDQIFGLVDDAWDDADLPVARADVHRLQLAATPDDRLDRKFYQRQFHYLLRPLEDGAFVAYAPDEVVPLDVVGPGVRDDRDGLYLDCVAVPTHPGRVFSRTHVPLPDALAELQLQQHVQAARAWANPHMQTPWAAYAQRGIGHVLAQPAADGSLKALLAVPPPFYRALDKPARRRLVFDWAHCLADTLCFVHARGRAHGRIRPSALLYTTDGLIVCANPADMDADDGAGADGHRRVSFDKEAYDYSAPEHHQRAASASQAVPVTPTVASTATRRSTIAEGGAGGRGAGVSMYLRKRDSEDRTEGGGGRVVPAVAAAAAVPAAADELTISRHVTTHVITPPNPQAADVFALGCVLLDLVSALLLKKAPRAFAAHRAARHKTAGRGGAVPDASFHRNLAQVESWVRALAKEARKKQGLEGVGPLLAIACSMLAAHPADRPTAPDVQTRLYAVLRGPCGIAEPHCVHAYAASPRPRSVSVAFAAVSYADGRARAPSSASVSASVSSVAPAAPASPTSGYSWGSLDRPLPASTSYGSLASLGTSTSSSSAPRRGWRTSQSHRRADSSSSTGVIAEEADLGMRSLGHDAWRVH